MGIDVFDTLRALELNEARREIAHYLLAMTTAEIPLATALDVGCGVGHFSSYLRAQGMSVVGVDVRAENVAEAQRRHPTLRFLVGDIEDEAIVSLGRFDFVLCLGLLYHLENPFRAMRNLAALTEKLVLIESMVVPTALQAAYLRQEEIADNQARDYIAMVPSESWFIKSLYQVGLPFVYTPPTLPAHRDFRRSILKRQKRTMIVGSRIALPSASRFRLLPEPPGVGPELWYRWPLPGFLRFQAIRGILTRWRGS